MSQKIWDSVRAKWIIETPEEKVRQGIIRYLADTKKYPRQLMGIEKKIDINGQPKRFDLVCYNQKAEPVLLVECKRPEQTIDQKTIDQAVVYNQILKAPFVLLTNGKKSVALRKTEDNSFEFVRHLPDFDKL